MFDYISVALASGLLLAILCALFGDDKRAKRGLAVLRTLVSVLRNRSREDEE